MKTRKVLLQEKIYQNPKSKRANNFFRGFLDRFSFYREDVAFNLLSGGKRLLDVGCGDGFFLVKVADKFDDLWGIDISSSRLKRAQENLARLKPKKRVHLLQADFDEKFPFSSNYFDAVTCIAALEASIDPYHVLREVRRVLKTGGIFILQVANMAFLPRRLALLFGKMPITWEKEELWNGGALHYFCLTPLIKLLKNIGFKVLMISGSGFLAPLRTFWTTMLSGDLIIKATKIYR